MDPIATNVSMLGAPERTLFHPLTKNFLLINITIAASTICITVMPMWFPSRNFGSGRWNMVCPIEKYISTSRNTTDVTSLRLRTGLSLSSRAFSWASREFVEDWLSSAPCTAAPYPASSTAFTMASLLALPSTPMELVSKLTDTDSTPGTLLTAFSTCA